MNMRKTAGWIGIAFVVCFVLSSPSDAGGVIHPAFSGIQSAADQLAGFLKSIAGVAG